MWISVIVSIRSYGPATGYIRLLALPSEVVTVGAVQLVSWALSANPTGLGGGGASGTDELLGGSRSYAYDRCTNCMLYNFKYK